MDEATEGYVWATYGSQKYLRQAVTSVTTLRRYDNRRPAALYCPADHRETLRAHGLTGLFQRIERLPEANQSIVGVKHHLHDLMPFDRCMWLDADMVWCRDPDPLWLQLGAFPFTATGLERADAWFGAPKGAGIILEYAFDRRRQTLSHFDLDHLPRVQSGLMYGRDRVDVERICSGAQEYLARQDETHFRSRLNEDGRRLESCEWSLAMSMSAHERQVFPWFYGHESPQLDYIGDLTEHDRDFRSVKCRYYCDRFVYSLRGIPNRRLRRGLIMLARKLPGRGDFMEVTPYLLHFGWLHEKAPFEAFAGRTWKRLISPDYS